MENFILYNIICSNGVLGTPLSSAANFGHHEVVKYLLSRDVSTDGGCDKCTLQVGVPTIDLCNNYCLLLSEHTSYASMQEWTCPSGEGSVRSWCECCY